MERERLLWNDNSSSFIEGELVVDDHSSSISSVSSSSTSSVSANSSHESSPLGWPLMQRCDGLIMPPKAVPLQPFAPHGPSSLWEPRRIKETSEISEVDTMKERFAKLLLGEDMSGGGQGVCTALAISNAITNLSVSVFGELCRLEPLSHDRKLLWKREIDCLVSVAGYIIEMVPSRQTLPDGNSLEIMVSRPRSDLHVNLPALRKLDAMLLECLDSFHETEFWYADDDAKDSRFCSPRRQEKWWLPSPVVPVVAGLSEGSRKFLEQRRECISQVLKAALAINNQTLLEMQVPEVYWNTLPKNGRVGLGESIYRHLTSEYFSPEALLCSLDLSTEHNALEVANRLEAAIYTWRRRRRRGGMHKKNSVREVKFNAKASWTKVKDFITDLDNRNEILSGRAQTLLWCLRQRFAGLPQTLLDATKIQHNRDVGQAILESYSRVLESLAFRIIARIEDVISVDDIVKNPASSLTALQLTPLSTQIPLALLPKSSSPSSSPRATGNESSDKEMIMLRNLGHEVEAKKEKVCTNISPMTLVGE